MEIHNLWQNLKIQPSLGYLSFGDPLSKAANVKSLSSTTVLLILRQS